MVIILITAIKKLTILATTSTEPPSDTKHSPICKRRSAAEGAQREDRWSPGLSKGLAVCLGFRVPLKGSFKGLL